ncbi:hypothetical protein AAVH_23771 [Aphelenchoides avenae]|nr:hypothetical protein AAVH_23771 [Aphelenchus avenae]
MLLNVKVGGTTYTFDVLDLGVLHYAFVNEFVIGSSSQQHATIESSSGASKRCADGGRRHADV